MENIDPLSYATVSVIDDIVYLEVSKKDFVSKMGKWLLEQEVKMQSLIHFIDLESDIGVILPTSLSDAFQKKFKPSLRELQKIFGVAFDLVGLEQVLRDVRDVPSLLITLLKPFSDEKIPIYSMVVANSKIYLYFLPQYHDETLKIVFR